MARTIRRKGVEHTYKSHHTWGFKTAGHYTTWDKYVLTGNGHGGAPVYREMTKWEKYQKDEFFHGESKHCNSRGPGWRYKEEYALMLDDHNDTQMRKYLSSAGEYDPVFMDNLPRSDLDWKMY